MSDARRWARIPGPSGRIPAAPLLLALALPACVQPLNLPWVGDCAEYPEGLYDFGDLGVGTCLAGPVDLKAIPDPDGEGGWRLYVANANPNLLFTSGSILTLDGDALEFAASEGGVTLSHEVTLANGGNPPLSYATRSYSGPLAYDDQRQALFYGNRLSFTSAQTTEDRVEGVYIGEAGALTVFDDFAEETGDGTYATVGHDPFGIARHPVTGQLYVFNTRSHDVTILDTDEDRAAQVRYARTYQPAELPRPALEDVGLPSLLEPVILEVDEETLPDDRFIVTYTDLVRRMFYPVEGSRGLSLTFADTADGFRFNPSGAGAVLEPGAGEDAWDKGGILDAAVLIDGEQYVAFYTSHDGGPTSIGFASTPGDWPAAWGKYDRGSNGLHDDDAILTPGPDAFDIGGVSAPTALRPDGVTFRLWYNATAADGTVSIAAVRGDNAIELEKQGVSLAGDGESAADPNVALRTGGGFAMYYVGGDLEASTCIRYADSSTGGITFTAGGEDGRAPGCLIEGGGDLPAILRSPRVVADAYQRHMWFVGADDVAGPWRLFQARSFDGYRWEVLGEAAVLPTADGQVDLPPLLSSISFLPASGIVGGFRVERENVGILSVGAGLGTVTTNVGLSFTVLSGHVLPAPAWEEPWWGDGDGRPVVAPVAFTDPAILPGDARLFITSEVDGAEPVIGWAEEVVGDRIPVGGLFQMPADEEGGISGLRGTSSAGVRGPWLLRPEASGDAVWMYYAEVTTAGAWRIRRAVSDDGGQTFGSASTLLSAVEGQTIGDPTVTRGHDGLYHMWYSSSLGGAFELRHATSSDGATFTRLESGGLVSGEPGSWDDAGVGAASVLWDEDAGIYRLWYTGDDGSRTRIGYAAGTPGELGVTWLRYRDPTSSLRQAVVLGSGLGWDNDGVRAPVVYEEDDRYVMYYQGDYVEGESRVGAAVSVDGIGWSPLTAPLTSGDSFTLTTAHSRTGDSDDPKADATVSVSLAISGDYSGVSGTEVEMVPMPWNGGIINCFAVLTTRRVPTVYLMDVYDDSSAANGGHPGPCVEATNPELFAASGEDFVDANFNALEEVFLLENNLSTRGTRTVTFSPDGSRMYLTSQFPDSVLVVDTAHFVDRTNRQTGEVDLPVVGFIEVARGAATANSDADNQTGVADYRADIGPTGLVISPLEGGRYAFVANANDHSVYTIDLHLGNYGQIVAVAPEVGDVPFDIELSPDGTLLFVGAYVGELDEKVANSTLAIISADPADPDFGQVIAEIKNREL